MLRRVCFYILPVFLALAFYLGTPASGFAGQSASAAPQSGAALSSPLAHGNLSEDAPDAIVSLRADQDGASDDGIIQTITIVSWPDVTFEVPFAYRTFVVGASHRPCAAPPRAPPTA